MAESDPIIFTVSMSSVPRGDAFAPRVAIVQQQGSIYKSITVDMGEEVYCSAAAALDGGAEQVRKRLGERFPQAEITFCADEVAMSTILLIDDSDVVQKLVSSVLEAEGHKVVVAGDLAHGVKAIRESRIDLILLDLNLPEVRGEAGIKLFRQRMRLTTPIIVLSGEIKAETVLNLKPLGVSAFVAKGEEFQQKLKQEIARVLGEDGGATSHVAGGRH
jgi:CheY-like chemotaxis protein